MIRVKGYNIQMILCRTNHIITMTANPIDHMQTRAWFPYKHLHLQMASLSSMCICAEKVVQACAILVFSGKLIKFVLELVVRLI